MKNQSQRVSNLLRSILLLPVIATAIPSLLCYVTLYLAAWDRCALGREVLCSDHISILEPAGYALRAVWLYVPALFPVPLAHLRSHNRSCLLACGTHCGSWLTLRVTEPALRIFLSSAVDLLSLPLFLSVLWVGHCVFAPPNSATR
ncbi:hypothetical protein NDU88_003701 [Pleurodeles waltl]|uniref:Uncharacterized protein n=1 Tax=Pleurodeles waltl TaxID=8319 RepID=A0AAV7PFD9_PLEWA|nr:hypothetical protein NDU88_003701 [Pleurodeles waltl]